MNRPPFERAIVVTMEETKTMLRAIDHFRRYIQKLPIKGPNSMGLAISEGINLAAVERRLEEVKSLMETDETIWEEYMREYEESSATEEDDE